MASRPMPGYATEQLTEIIDSNRYRLTRKIAEGGMGSVYEAILSGSDNFQKVVAIKIIRERYSADRSYVDMFIGEARLVADLVHQNIVQIYQLGKFQNIYYIAMEFINGVNLNEFLIRHQELGWKVPIDLGAFIISRICRGLEYAHEKRDKQGNALKVVHRDISPKNLMISAEGEVKITDFGIAKARNLIRDREGEALFGKVHYMSPEQAQRLPTDRRSDLFSLSVVMFELLTGLNIFLARDIKEMLFNVVHREIPSPRNINSDIPKDLERILLRGLTREIDNRYQSAADMAYDLEYFMYHKGYGPTIKTLERHMRKLFPHLYIYKSAQPEDSSPALRPPVDTEGATL